MEIHQLRYFLATCETLNFTRAAEVKNVSQPALTKAIHTLEAELGGTLFDTQSRPIRLTPFGELLRDHVAKVEDLLSDIKSISTKFHNLEDSSFSIGITNTIGKEPFVDIIRRLQERLLGVSISVVHVDQSELIDALKTGSLELAVVTDFPIYTSLLDAVDLYSEDYLIAAQPGSEIANLDQVFLRDLHGCHYINRLHCERLKQITESLKDAGVKLNVVFETDQDDFVRLMTNAGFGFSIMPKSLVEPSLVLKVVQDMQLTRTVRLVSRKDRRLSPVATRVREAVQDVKHILTSMPS